ncbi:hypothetical protein Ae201684P_009646 [Aphanomyces euteiches]|nr:hypothetical protein Ae201684P_009646 [Aphanomyces euteiches]
MCVGPFKNKEADDHGFFYPLRALPSKAMKIEERAWTSVLGLVEPIFEGFPNGSHFHICQLLKMQTAIQQEVDDLKKALQQKTQDFDEAIEFFGKAIQDLRLLIEL